MNVFKKISPYAFLLLIVSVVSCNEVEKRPSDLYSIEVSKDRIVFDHHGGTATIYVTTNAQWEINTNSTWISFEPTARRNERAENVTITITAPPYDVFNHTRNAEISIRSGDLATDFTVRRFISIAQIGEEFVANEPGIWTVSDFIQFAEEVNNNVTPDFSRWQDEDGVINLMSDINFGSIPIPVVGGDSDANGMDPTIVSQRGFNAIFDGNGHTIRGTLDNTLDGAPRRMVALFARLHPEGVIRNLTVDVIAENNFGAGGAHLAAIVGFSLTATTGYIENVTSKGTLTSTAGNRVGGIIAFQRTNVTNATNYADIIALAANRVGGISGATNQPVSIINSVNHGNITTAVAGTQAGGIVGQANPVTMIGTQNFGNITGRASGATVIGGLIGNAQGASAIGRSDGEPNINHGNIILMPVAEGGTAPTAASGAGGISGGVSAAVPFVNNINNGNVTSNVDHANVAVGGIIGHMSALAPLTNCVNAATAVITSAANAGGLIGRTTAANVLTNCTNAGTVNRLAAATVAPSHFGSMVGNGATVTFVTSTFGGTVLGAPGTEANAIGTP